MDKKKEKVPKPSMPVHVEEGVDEDVQELSDEESAEAKQSTSSAHEDSTGAADLAASTSKDDDAGSESSIEMIEDGDD